MTNGITIKGGNIKSGPAAKAAIEPELALQAAAGALIKTIQSYTPVRTGNLKGRWGTLQGTRWQGNTLRVDVVNTAPYAQRVNTVGRSAGYADRGIAAGRAQVLSQLKVNVGHVAKQLWDKGGK